MPRRGLGNYQEDNPNRQDQNPDDLSTPENRGRLVSPITKPIGDLTPQECACRTLQAIESAFEYYQRATDVPFLFTPPEGVVPVPASGSSDSHNVLIVDMIVPEKHYGYLQKVYLQTVPQSAYDIIRFQVRISGGAQPYFSPNPFFQSGIDGGYDFKLKCQPGKRFQVYAINTGTPLVYATAKIAGFLRPVGSIPG